MKTAIASLLVSILLLASAVEASTSGLLSPWEISVDFIPPSEENLQIFLNVKNTGTEDISGLQISLIADNVEYVESEKLSFDDKEAIEKLGVTVSQDQGRGVISVKLPGALKPAESKQLFINFKTKGLLKKEGAGYTARIRFDEPKLILPNGNTVPLNMETGSFRIHTPEGFVYNSSNPTPWREIWQGVSGFNAHFIQIFNGGTPITQDIAVSFRESETIRRAVELYKNLKAQEANKTRPKEQLDEANHRITNGANYVILGKGDLAKIELDTAESILTGKPLEDIISKSIKPMETGGTTGNGTYVIAVGLIALVLLIVVFGKKITAVFKGGEKDEK